MCSTDVSYETHSPAPPQPTGAGENSGKKGSMATITVGQENGTDIEIFYEDHGSGQPVVLIHGYPAQRTVLGEAGTGAAAGRLPGHHLRPARVRQLQPAHRRIRLRHLRRRPQGAARPPRAADVVLVGFSMGTGEVTRYLGTYGSDRHQQGGADGRDSAVPAEDGTTPKASTASVFEGIKEAVVADRPAYFKDFLDNFYNVDVLGGTRISDQAWQNSFNVAVAASAYAAYACVDTWLTDFRDDLPKFDIPTLLIHGDADRILPYESTGCAAAGADQGPGGGHGPGRPAQHRLDPSRRGQSGAAGVSRQVDRRRPAQEPVAWSELSVQTTPPGGSALRPEATDRRRTPRPASARRRRGFRSPGRGNGRGSALVGQVRSATLPQ